GRCGGSVERFQRGADIPVRVLSPRPAGRYHRLMPPVARQSTIRNGEVPSIEAMLRTVPGFDQLASPVLERIASMGKIAEARQGDVLFRKGEMPEWLHVLLEGRVSLTGIAAGSSSAVV